MATLYGLLAGLLFGSVIINMFLLIGSKDDFKAGISLGIIAASIIGILTIFINLGYLLPNEYKKGQIDAMTGIIKYELKENPDKTKEWKEIKK